MARNRCRIEGCKRRGISGGICTTHRYRLKNELPIDGPPRPPRRRKRIGRWLTQALRKLLEE